MTTSIYLSMTVYFDTELMLLIERIGFIKRTSRALKFNVFFGVLAMLCVAMVLKDSHTREIWVSHPEYFTNMIYNFNKYCPSANLEWTDMGMIASFNHTSILFYIFGVVFGASSSMPNIKLLNWINTGIFKKLIRMGLAALIFGLIEIGA